MAKPLTKTKTKIFFYDLSRDHSKGIQFCARDSSKKVVGFATLYFNFSSLKPGQLCILNDLYVDDSCRGQGVGKELIKYSKQYASDKGFDSITWVTASDNVTAQKLYDSLTKDKFLWFEYQLK
jgi:ribosomal protein S18 acetylase RimI-like enzyme